VTSANVACGFHAGDPTVLRRVTERAAERGVSIGAQVGYRDLPGFGRRFIDVDPAELVNDVIYQIATQTTVPSYGAMLVFRCLQGIGAALVMSCGVALVTSLCVRFFS